MKRERAEPTHRAGWLAVVDGANGFGGIFDDGDAVALADGEQAIHVAEVAVKMHGDDGFGVKRDGLLDEGGIGGVAHLQFGDGGLGVGDA